MKKMTLKIHRPFAPKSWKVRPYEWLSSADIEKL